MKTNCKGECVDTNADKNNKYILQSVDNSLVMIELIANNPGLRITDIAQRMSIGKSTVFRLLYTLENRGFIQKDAANTYMLGLKFMRFGTQVLNQFDITDIAHPFMKKLSEGVGETIHLVIWDGDSSVRFIDRSIGTSTIRMESYIGMIRPAYTSATGKVLLSHKGDDFIRHYLETAELKPLTEFTCTSPGELEAILRTIRQRGYGEDNNESEIGLSCIAAPIFSAEGTVIAAISISGSSERIKMNKEWLIAQVKQTANEISVALKSI